MYTLEEKDKDKDKEKDKDNDKDRGECREGCFGGRKVIL